MAKHYDANAVITVDEAGNYVAPGGGGSVNPNGQATMANSAPVVIASNQSAVPTTSDFSKIEDAAHASGDSGVPSWGVRNDGATTVFTNTNGDYSPLAVDGRGVQFIRTLGSATTSTPASFVLAAATAQTVLATNTNRLGATIVNRSGQEVFIRFGGVASATVFHWVLANNDRYEVPFGITLSISAFSVSAGTSPGLVVAEFSA